MPIFNLTFSKVKFKKNVKSYKFPIIRKFYLLNSEQKAKLTTFCSGIAQGHCVKFTLVQEGCLILEFDWNPPENTVTVKLPNSEYSFIYRGNNYYKIFRMLELAPFQNITLNSSTLADQIEMATCSLTINVDLEDKVGFDSKDLEVNNQYRAFQKFESDTEILFNILSPDHTFHFRYDVPRNKLTRWHSSLLEKHLITSEVTYDREESKWLLKELRDLKK